MISEIRAWRGQLISRMWYLVEGDKVVSHSDSEAPPCQ